MMGLTRNLGRGALLFVLTACAPAFTATPGVVNTPTATPTLTIAATPPATVTASATLPPTQTATSTKTATATATTLPTATRPRPAETAVPQSSPIPPSPVPIQAGGEEQQVIDLINQVRTQNNLPALTVEARLMAAAEGHSLDMAQHNFFAHEGSAGSTVEDRLTRQGYAWNFYAENLGCGYDSAEAVVQGWLDSAAHRDNVLAADARQIGVGYVSDQGGDCRTYWTAVFAAGR